MMKKSVLAVSTFCFCLSALADNIRSLDIRLHSGVTDQVEVQSIDSLYYSEDGSKMLLLSRSGCVREYEVGRVSEMSFGTLASAVSVVYDGAKASVVNPFASVGVDVMVSGADVVVKSTTENEVVYELSGASSDGLFKVYSDKKYEIDLLGLDLTNQDGPAINLQSKKKCELSVKSGTVNNLADGSMYAKSDEDQKGTIFSEGQIEFKGKGVLNVTGNNKHAICSDDYVLVKNATINVLGAVSDAIHAKDYFTLESGKLNLVASGDGIDSDGDITILDGTLAVSLSEDGGVESDEVVEDSKTYRVYVSVPMASANTGMGGTGMGPGNMGGTQNSAWTNVYLYASDGTRVAQLSQSVTISGSNNTSLTFFYYDFGQATSGSFYFASDDFSQSVGGRPGSSSSTTYSIVSGAFPGPVSGENVYYQIASSYSTSGTTRSYSLSDVSSVYASGTVAGLTGDTYSSQCVKSASNIFFYGGVVDLVHTGTMSKGVKADLQVVLDGSQLNIYPGGAALIVNNDPSYCSAIKCNDFLGLSGSLFVDATGFASRGLSADNSIEITGGSYVINLSGDGGTYMSASGLDGYGACGLKCDGAVSLSNATIEILASGRGGKGINVEGNLVLGLNDSDALTLSVKTSGAATATSGSGMNLSFVGSPKAIKAIGDIAVNGGNIFVSTKSDGGEGLESKKSIVFNGGAFEGDTYDDAINAATKITFNDGFVYAHASGNDGIDCNGSAGFEFNGGVVLASGAKSPEEGFDCDNNSFKINGGVLIGTGGATSNPTSASQPYSTVTNTNVTAGTYLVVKDSSGKVLYAYRCPNTVSGATVLLSSPEFSKGTSCSLVYGATSVSGATSTAFGGVFSVGGTVTGGTSKTFSPTTK